MALQPGISVLVPAYRSEGSLPELIERLGNVLAVFGEAEIIVVEDASPDQTRTVLLGVAAAHSRVRPVLLDKNGGQHAALLRGVSEARFDICVTIDDDLQHHPEDLPLLVAAVHAGVDLAYGRYLNPRTRPVRRLGGWLIRRFAGAIAGCPDLRNASPYRCFRTELLAGAFPAGRDTPLDLLLCVQRPRVATIAVRQEARMVGKSTYTPARIARLTWQVFVSSLRARRVLAMQRTVGRVGA
jgi:undecaprenyl-phosphate 4-deoxy-4-formamido-L-arabinose transferase